MTQPLTLERFPERSMRIDEPVAAGPILARTLLASRLERADTLLTVVQAMQGAGKTTGVASWASSVSGPRGLVWISLDESNQQPDLFVPRLVEAFGEAGMAGIPQLGLRNLAARPRRRAVLAAMATALRADGPWVLVLDDFPTGPSSELGADIEYLVKQAHRTLRVVVVTNGEPAIELHRLRMDGDLSVIRGADLDLTRAEVAQMLRAYGVDSVESTVTTVWDHTHGWAAGVRLACQALRHQPTDAAMDSTDAAIDTYLAAEVLDALPADVRSIVDRLALVDSVPLSILQESCRLAGHRAAMPAALPAFVSLAPDGRVSLHPVLRSVAARRVLERSPAEAHEWIAAVARWHADRGEAPQAFALAAQAGEWPWIGRTLVEQLAVSEVLAGSASPWATRPEVLDCEPVLRAAVAVAGGDVAHARAALREITSTDSMSDQLSASIIDLAIAALTSDHPSGLELAASIRELSLGLPPSMRSTAGGLAPLVDSFEGMLEFGAGRLNRAAIIFARVTSAPRTRRCSSIRRLATGHLALIEAIRGNLTRASELVDEVMTAAERFGGRAGTSEAMVALAWIHLERLELDESRSALQRSRAEASDQTNQLTAALRDVVEVRVLTSAGEPVMAARHARALGGHDQPSGWASDLAIVALAQAWLAQGEPRRALKTLTPEPSSAMTESRVVGAAARAAIGDFRGARALLAAASDTLVDPPLPVQLDGWILDARLAYDDGNVARAGLLVERALSAARSEGLRTALAPSHSWLRSFLNREPSLLRTYREFVASLASTEAGGASSSVVIASRSSSEQVIEPLSERETQVLELLALMCSTDEIAAELFVSGNTVKTHVKSIFRKLGVNRRVDAVRVARSYGLC